MPDSTRSPYLGPHVVGQRVVVRRLVPGETGPTGGPAFTDVLGDCVAWDPCVVVTATGERVEIPLELIVSGKPVPPRPSVRLRASVAEAEAHVASLWPSMETMSIGDWTLRTTNGSTRKRANSCLAVGNPGVPLGAALDQVAEFYGTHGRTALLHVEAGGEVEAGLLRLGCTPLAGGQAEGEADFMLASVSRTLRVLRGLGDSGRAVELAASGTRAAGSIGTGCDPMAEGMAALSAAGAGAWLGLHGLEVDPTYRRQGLARSVLRSLLDWGAEQGATTAWLHVETDNQPALALYGSLGFVTHHTMRYLQLPA